MTAACAVRPGSPFVIYGYGGSVNNFTDVVYPGQLNRCDACHVGTSYYPVDDTAVQATTFLTGLSKESPNPTTVGNPIATSANMSVCSACHVDTVSRAHMLQNGGSTTVAKDAEGRTIPSPNPANAETCSVCHGAGGVADVKVVHNIPDHGELSAAVRACLPGRRSGSDVGRRLARVLGRGAAEAEPAASVNAPPHADSAYSPAGSGHLPRLP